MKLLVTTVVLCVLAIGRPSLVAGQSLAELARQEAARRQTIARGKVITNSDLKPVPPPSAAPPTSTPGTTLAPPPTLEQAGAASADDAAGDSKAIDAASAGEDKKDEKYWRQRVTAARDNLTRSQTFQQALQARVAALSTDFVNRDDPAQRAKVAQDREKALAELDRVSKDIVRYQTELTTIADDARRAGVPAGWVR